jgi:hypothetical protein
MSTQQPTPTAGDAVTPVQSDSRPLLATPTLDVDMPRERVLRRCHIEAALNSHVPVHLSGSWRGTDYFEQRDTTLWLHSAIEGIEGVQGSTFFSAESESGRIQCWTQGTGYDTRYSRRLDFMGQFSRVLVRPPSARSAMAAVSAAELGVLMRKIQAYEPDLFDLVLSFVPRTLMQPQSNDHGTYSVGLVGSSAFRNCSRLVEVVLPRSITRIGVHAFLYCRHLTELTLPECLTHIDDFAFQGCIALRAVVLPNSLVHIGSMTFAQCTALTELMLPDSLTYIGRRAFQQCVSLKVITCAPTSSLAHIGPEAFSRCCSLVKVTLLGDSLTHMGDFAFAECWTLTSVVLPNSLTHIDGAAFQCCASLTTIELPDSLIHIGSGAFRCSGLTTVTLPDSLTHIESDAFSCTALTTVTLPNSLTHIGDRAFKDCADLTRVVMPAMRPFVGTSAFSGCTWTLWFTLFFSASV